MCSFPADCARLSEVANLRAPNNEETKAGLQYLKEHALSASKIIDAYTQNELSADAKFKGNYVAVSGRIGRIAKGLTGNPYITLEIGPYQITSIQCFFDSTNELKLRSSKSWRNGVHQRQSTRENDERHTQGLSND